MNSKFKGKRLHDEATALRKYKTERHKKMIAGMRAAGFTEEQIEAALKAAK